MALSRFPLKTVFFLLVFCLLAEAFVHRPTRTQELHARDAPEKCHPTSRRLLARWPRHRPLSEDQKILIRQRLHGSFEEDPETEKKGLPESLGPRAQVIDPEADVQDTGVLCPEADFLRPCTCDPHTLTLDCSLEIDMIHLYTIFHNTPFFVKNFNSFVMAHDSTVMPPGNHYDNILLDNTFAGVSFREIYIANTNLTKVEPNAFAGSETTLHKLSLRRNLRLSAFPFSKLRNFKQIVELQVTDGSLTRVDAFGPMENLHLIHLFGNQINYIEPGAFVGAPNLQLIDLAFNQLATLTAGSFGLSSPVASVWIDNNQISSINDYTFGQRLPILLDVSANQLTTLKESVFQPILESMISSTDNYVNALDNPIDCTEVTWIIENAAYSSHLFMPCPGMMPR